MKGKTAEVFHPGYFVQEEMEARGWSVETMMERSMLNRQSVEELLARHRNVTPIVAGCLGHAFGTSKEFWLNLQKSWAEGKRERLSEPPKPKRDDDSY